MLTAGLLTGKAQPKRLDPKSDTTFWLPLKQIDRARIGLPDLMISHDSIHIRYWMENTAVDIWTKDRNKWTGIVSHHTVVMKSEGVDIKAGKYYSKRENLAPEEAKKSYELFRQSGVLEFPSDGQIRGWQEGDDGAEYLLELSTPGNFSFKAYWTPDAQNGVPEASSIDSLNHQLERLLELRSRWSSFLDSLPPGCYAEGEMMMVYNHPKIHGKASHK